MTWSYSEYQLFKKCPRKWFFKSIFADARANDPERQEAYLLSKMQSLYAWRGQVVESAIQDFLIPSLEVDLQPTLQDTIKVAKKTFDEQLAFGVVNRDSESESSTRSRQRRRNRRITLCSHVLAHGTPSNVRALKLKCRVPAGRVYPE
jgi:hypothetical protein